MAAVRRSPLAKVVLGGTAAVAWLSHGPAFMAVPSTELRASAACATGVGSAQGIGCSAAGLTAGARGIAQSRQGIPAAAGPEVLTAFGVELGETVLGLFLLYAIMSLNEYIYHRYFQHLGVNMLDLTRTVRKTLDLETYRGDGHVEHHRETLEDMTLDMNMRKEKPNAMLDADPWRGTAFPWMGTLKMTTAVMIQAYPVLSLLGWSGPAIVATVLAAMTVHAMVWNTLHPHMHGLPDVPLSQGIPSVLTEYRDSELFNWLRMNHEGHHRTEGAEGNYNVCCPLMDQLVGTYIGEIKPREEFLNKVPASA